MRRALEAPVVCQSFPRRRILQVGQEARHRGTMEDQARRKPPPAPGDRRKRHGGGLPFRPVLPLPTSFGSLGRAAEHCMVLRLGVPSRRRRIVGSSEMLRRSPPRSFQVECLVCGRLLALATVLTGSTATSVSASPPGRTSAEGVVTSARRSATRRRSARLLLPTTLNGGGRETVPSQAGCGRL